MANSPWNDSSLRRSVAFEIHESAPYRRFGRTQDSTMLLEERGFSDTPWPLAKKAPLAFLMLFSIHTELDSYYYCNTETEKNLRGKGATIITQRGSFLRQISSLSTLPPRVKKTKTKATNSFCNIFSEIIAMILNPTERDWKRITCAHSVRTLT